MNYIITGDGFTSHLLQELNGQFGVKLLTENALAESNIQFNEDDKLYVPSQSALELVMARMNSPERLTHIQQLSDKYQCRDIMRPLFPDFFYATQPLADITPDMFAPNRKYVIKPQKGFFSIGVKIIENPCKVMDLVAEMQSELAANGGFSESIFSHDTVIIEEFIEGEEYAVDMFYSATGEPIITNITYHPLPYKADYHHVLYYSNYRIFQHLYSQAETFFTQLNTLLNLHSFPIHAEFKLTPENTLLPVELNPLRYGGFGLGDLSFHAYGQSPYLAFFQDKPYAWETIWNTTRQQHHYAWVLAYNGTGVDMTGINIESVHDKLRQFIGNDGLSLIRYEKMDYLKNPVFAIAYLAEPDEERLTRWLQVEFDNCFAEIEKSCIN